MYHPPPGGPPIHSRLQWNPMRRYDPKPPASRPWHDLTEPQLRREALAACHTRPGKKPGCACNNCATLPPPAKPEPERLNRYAQATEHTNAIAYTDYYKKVCARNFKNFHPRWAHYASRLDPDLRPDLMKRPNLRLVCPRLRPQRNTRIVSRHRPNRRRFPLSVDDACGHNRQRLHGNHYRPKPGRRRTPGRQVCCRRPHQERLRTNMTQPPQTPQPHQPHPVYRHVITDGETWTHRPYEQIPQLTAHPGHFTAAGKQLLMTTLIYPNGETLQRVIAHVGDREPEAKQLAFKLNPLLGVDYEQAFNRIASLEEGKTAKQQDYIRIDALTIYRNVIAAALYDLGKPTPTHLHILRNPQEVEDYINTLDPIFIQLNHLEYPIEIGAKSEKNTHTRPQQPRQILVHTMASRKTSRTKKTHRVPTNRRRKIRGRKSQKNVAKTRPRQQPTSPNHSPLRPNPPRPPTHQTNSEKNSPKTT